MQDVCYPLKLRAAFFYPCLLCLQVGHCKFVHCMQMNRQCTSFEAVKNYYRQLGTTELWQTNISSCFIAWAVQYLIKGVLKVEVFVKFFRWGSLNSLGTEKKEPIQAVAKCQPMKMKVRLVSSTIGSAWERFLSWGKKGRWFKKKNLAWCTGATKNTVK